MVKGKIPKNHESSGILDRKNHQVSNQLTEYEKDGGIQSASDTAYKLMYSVLKQLAEPIVFSLYS